MDEVPHDEEVAGEIELLDELQFVFDLAAGAMLRFRRGPTVTPRKTLPGAVSQKRIHGFALGNGVARELIAEIFECEFETRREFHCVGNGFRQIGEQLLHFLRRLQVAFGIA